MATCQQYNDTDFTSPLLMLDQPKGRAMLIEAGKKYVKRNGDIVGPMVRREDLELWPWTYEGFSWREGGTYWFGGEGSDHDLVRLAPGEKPTLVIEAGKRYVTRDGSPTGKIAALTPGGYDPCYVWQATMEPLTRPQIWTRDGRYFNHVDSHHLDIVAEFEGPGIKLEAGEAVVAEAAVYLRPPKEFHLTVGPNQPCEVFFDVPEGVNRIRVTVGE